VPVWLVKVVSPLAMSGIGEMREGGGVEGM